MPPIRSFFAYPSGHPELTGAIEAAARLLRAEGRLELTAWPQQPVFGAFIPDEIRSAIRSSDVLLADVTKPNLNVYYEIGFAIGTGKAVAPVLNVSFADAAEHIRREGMFDNIGYKTYENAGGLASVLGALPNASLSELYGRPLNHEQPLYVLDSFRKTDFRNAIVSAIKDSKVFFRSFDPVEIARFSAVGAIADVTASAGVVIPILGEHIDDAANHNLRAAFVAGLADGLGRNALLLRMEAATPPVMPADFRDNIRSVRNEGQIGEIVKRFTGDALIASQSIRKPKQGKRTPLQRVNLGASAAENEFRTLEDYFVETSEFLKALNGEARIVAGRKGSGKTAIFYRVSDELRLRKGYVIAGLKPESHQLSLFRQELSNLVEAGTFDHTLAAFWYYVILCELLLAMRRTYEQLARVDDAGLAAMTEIDKVLGEVEFSSSGDFTFRINRLVASMLQEIQRLKHKGEPITASSLTNMVFRGGMPKLRATIEKLTKTDSHLVLLFDNIDKGWPAAGVDDFDVRLVRLLIETLDRMRNDFHAVGREFMSVVFLRNDIYELLVSETPDRGKAGELRIDWTDRAKLRQVIYRRLVVSTGLGGGFEELWTRFFPEKVGLRDSFEYFVDHCLMRPRFLINIIDGALANGINRAHDRMSESDCMDAVRQHSNYLVSDFGFEIRDVAGLSADILYAFVGARQALPRSEIDRYFLDFGLERQELDRALRLMLWYGVLGVRSRDGKERFIYDFDYNMRRLEAEVRSVGSDVEYIVNPALFVALQ